jgi:hypothetical protein
MEVDANQSIIAEPSTTTKMYSAQKNRRVPVCNSIYTKLWISLLGAALDHHSAQRASTLLMLSRASFHTVHSTQRGFLSATPSFTKIL